MQKSTDARGRALRPRFVAAAFAVALGAALATNRTTIASDHQDTPEVELNQTMDVNDVYAFPGSAADRIVLVMTTASPIAPGANIGFNPNLLYQLKVDNTGDGVEDKVIQVTFTGTGSAQQVHLRGPVSPAQTGVMNTLVASGPLVEGPVNTNIGAAPNVQVFAGLRDDPFWIDLEQFMRILPDRKPVSGTLAALPDAPTAGAWRPAGQAVDFLKGLNCLAIVVEMPASMLTAGGNAKIGVWGTISR